jgi:hypothetical protein
MSFWTDLTKDNGKQLNDLTTAVNSVATTVGAVAGDVSNLHQKVDTVKETVATQAALNGTAGAVTAENLTSMQGVLEYFGGVKKLADGVTKALANTEGLCLVLADQLKADLTDAAKEVVKTLNILIDAVHGQDTTIRAQTAMIEDLAKRMAPANGEQAEPAPVTEDDPAVQELANELAEEEAFGDGAGAWEGFGGRRLRGGKRMLYYVPILSIDEVTQKRSFLGGVFLHGTDEDDASRTACRIARRDKDNPLLDLETMVTECDRTIVAAGKIGY